MIRQFAVGLLLAVSLAARAAPVVTHLVSYRGQVQKIDAHTAHVTATFTTSGGSGPLSVVLAQWEGDTISGLSVDEDGRPVSAQVQSDPAVIRVVIPPSPASVHVVSFTVEHANGNLHRIPLAVPSAAPLSGRQPVELDVKLPAGEVHYGDLFPRMDWESETAAHTTLATVPSLLILHSRAAGGITAADAWSASRIADICMTLLLVSGSLTWWIMYRSGKAPAGGH
jgi:hypothetical protein